MKKRPILEVALPNDPEANKLLYSGLTIAQNKLLATHEVSLVANIPAVAAAAEAAIQVLGRMIELVGELATDSHQEPSA